MYKSNINLNLYKTFYEVAKYGSISETAKQTYTSQPAISKAIKNLENELNVKLFYRDLNGVSLTEKGRELLYFVEESYNNLIIAERNMIETENLNRGKLSIGMPSNVGTFYLLDKIIDFHNEYPNIEITIVTGSTNQLLSLLESHKVDFIIDTSPINTKMDAVIKEVKTVEYCFIVKKDSTIKNINKIKSLKDLKDKPLILPISGTANRKNLDIIFESNNIEVSNVINIHTSEMIISAVKKDLGIGYIIKDLVFSDIENDNLMVIDVKEKLPTVAINLIYLKKYLTKAPIYFINKYIGEKIKY